jgi:hypothetical protein
MAVTLSLFAGAGAQFFDNSGNVLTGGKIYTYAAGTTTPAPTYTTVNGNVFRTNPIVLDAAGRLPAGGELWLPIGVGYKFIIKTSTEVLIATYDNIPSAAQAPAANDADSIMYEQGYTVTAGSFVVGKIYRIVSLGTTNFTLIGAPTNTIGTHFIATGVGTGNGTAELSQTVETKLRQIISVKDFGAVGDGVTDDTLALTAAAAALQDGQTLDFVGGTYLISYQGTPYSSVYGNVIMEFDGLSDLTFNGSGATIKVVNHNISTYGGLRFMNFISCKRIAMSGLNFDMTFTGVNTSGSFYPFCGAITALDVDGATPAFSTLNSDFIFNDIKFKLFHPYGNWATTSNPIGGDSNNGYKLFSIFVQGPATANAYENQCRNIAIQNCTFLKGHNGYGIWLWAWNNCEVTGCIAEYWVTKHSNNNGTYAGGGVAMIRHIPYRTEGIIVQNNQFHSIPTAERVSSFEGVAQFYVLTSNIGALDIDKGLSIVSNNNIILGTGSLNGGVDYDKAVFFSAYGKLVFADNNIDGHIGQNPAIGTGVNALDLVPGSQAGEGNGFASITVDANIFGPWNFGGIYFTNGSNISAAMRRCKSLTVTNNTFNSGDYFLRMTSFTPTTHEGCESVVITGNIIQSQNAGIYPPPSVNNYGIFLAATTATDSVIVSNNVIRDKTYSILTDPVYVNALAQVRRFDNQYTNITDPFVAGIFPIDKTQAVDIQAISNSATFEPTVRCTNTVGTTAEVMLYQQQVNSFIMATNRLDVFTDGAAQTVTDSNVFRPAVDNTKNLGDASFRWANVYAGNGSIITVSDKREKQQVKDIDAAVMRAWGKVNYQQFKFNQAVETKGDGARWHIGVIAQQVKEAFESEGLDAFAYGLLCYDQWEDQYEDVLVEVEVQNSDGSISKMLQGNGEKRIALPAGNRYGIRYEEALALECAYLRSKLGA